jgi:hypothetical protein
VYFIKYDEVKWEVEVELRAFLNLAIGGSEWFYSLAALRLREKAPVPMVQGARLWRVKALVPLPGIEPRNHGCPARGLGTNVNKKGRAMAQAVSRRPPTAEARIRSRGQSMWDLWWTKWHWDRFFPEYFGFPLSTSFHRCSITRKRTKTNHHLHLHHRVAQ